MLRLTLRFTGQAEELLNSMSHDNNIPPKEIILDALSLYQMVLDQSAQGKRLSISSENGATEGFITTPTLAQLTQKQKANFA